MSVASGTIPHLHDTELRTQRILQLSETAARTAVWSAVVVAAGAAVAMAWSFFASPGYTDYVEGLVLFHQTQAAAGENIYDPAFRAAPPYSIPLYGPVFYYLCGFLLTDHPSLVPGRLVSTASLIGLAIIAWRLLRTRFQTDRMAATVGALPWLALMGPMVFGTNNRVDSLSILLGISALVFATSGRRFGWAAAALLLIVTGFTKPTSAVAPGIAIVIAYVINREWRSAVLVSAVTLLGAALVLFLGDQMSVGNFSECLIHSNVNPMSIDQGIDLTRWACKQHLLPVGIFLAFPMLLDRRFRPFAIHALLAFTVAVVTGAKVGSNINYFIESSWAAMLCYAATLRWWREMPRMKLLAFTFTAAMIFQTADRAWKRVGGNQAEIAGWSTIAKLVDEYGHDQPILTMQIGAQMLSGQQPYVADAHIVTRLAEAGQFSEEPILRDLREQRLAAVIADRDILPNCVGHTNWTAAVREAVQTYYKPAKSYGTLTVYVPKETIATAQITSPTKSVR